MSTIRKSVIAAVVAAFVAVVVVAWAAPVKAATTTDLSDVRYITSMLKQVWVEDLNYDDHEVICGYYYVSPRLARNEMANTFHDPYDGALREYSLYDVRRAVWRLLNWAC